MASNFQTFGTSVPRKNYNYTRKKIVLTVGWINYGTGKYFSEALIHTSNNPKHDKRLFIELRIEYM